MDHIVFCFGVREQIEVVYICVFVREVLRKKKTWPSSFDPTHANHSQT